jgi:hypothetical protein
MKIINWCIDWPAKAGTYANGKIEVGDNATDDEIDVLVLREIRRHVTWGWGQEGDPDVPDGDWPNIRKG